MLKKLSFLLVFISLVPSSHGFSTTYNFGDVKVNLPFKNVSCVYLYDLVQRETLIGAETPLMTYKNVTGVIGATTDMNGTDSVAGVPFVGLHVKAPETWFNDIFTVGCFVGRDFKRGVGMAGLKASIKLW